MDLFAPLDQYCERVDTTFWAEPFNFLSNLGFIVAGILIIRFLKSLHFSHKKTGAWFLAVLIILIGVGSALFHSFANVWTMWADVIPIAAFVITYVWLFLRHTVGATIVNSLFCLLFFGILSVAVAKLANPAVANGGEAYFGTWISLFGMSCFYAGRKQINNHGRLLVATIIFGLSIFFRTIDPNVCTTFPLGTHVFWHLCNSLVLYLVTIAYVSERGKV